MTTRTRTRPGYTLTRLDTVAKRRVGGTKNRTPWLWDGHLPPASLGMLDGDPGLGKSMITADWAARVTKGGKWPDGSAVHGGAQGVLFVAAEDTAEEIAARCQAHGADLTKIHHLKEVGGETPSIPRDLSIIEAIIRENNVRLVVIDPIMIYLGVHSGSDQQARKATGPLAKLAQESGTTIVMVRHLTKEAKSAKSAGGGSMGMIGQCRFGYLVGPDPDDPKRRIVANTKMNNGPEPLALAYRLRTQRNGAPHVDWEEKPVEEIDADMLIKNRKVDPAQRNEREEAVNFLRDTLEHGEEHGCLKGVMHPPTLFGLGKEAGFTVSQIRTAKGKLMVVSRKLGPGWFWCLPDRDLRKLDATEIADLIARQQEARAAEAAEKEEKKSTRSGSKSKARTTERPGHLRSV